MNNFRVWIRPLGDFCRVRVDGIENRLWLLDRLSQSFVFRTFEPLETAAAGSQQCTFQVPCNPPLSQSSFQKMLVAMPRVQLMKEPA
jgi:hypothetical protein